MIMDYTNQRRTTREHHRPHRIYYIKPRGAEAIRIERKMPVDANDVPLLWV